MNDERARLGKVTAVIARWELRGHVRHFIYEIRKNKYKIRVIQDFVFTTKYSSNCSITKIESRTIIKQDAQHALKPYLILNY